MPSSKNGGQQASNLLILISFYASVIIPNADKGKMNVLIVEDDGATRQVMNHLISARGHHITACGSTEEAEQVLSREKVDMFILDWMLPGRSGPDFCRWLREQPEGNDYYILLATGRSTSADLDEALDAGANDYLVKPWEREIFRSRLRIAERQVLDIAERRKSRLALHESNQRRERLALVARQTQNGVVILSAEGQVEWINAAFDQMIGDPCKPLVDQHFSKFLNCVEPSQRAEIEDAIQTGRANEGELSLIGSDNMTHWLHYSLTPLDTDQGKSRGQVCLFSDITLVKLADEERFKSSKLESLGVLAGGIAHDLNNVLTVISGNIALARLAIDLPKPLGHLDTAEQAAMQATSLSKQLLTFAKGGDPLKQDIDLKELIENATTFALRGSNLQCTFNLGAGLKKVEADPFQIEQVVNTIVINAREAMPNGGKLQVRAQNTRLSDSNPYDLPHGEYVRVSFADNGPGIPVEVLPRIFDPYFTTKPTGSGIGLTMAFSIISKHGGHVRAEAAGGGGTIITILLPSSKTKIPKQKVKHEKLVGPLSVLCMDDEPAIRDLTSAMLSLSGYDVVSTCDGQEALAAYTEKMKKGQRFDAVILDATIPGGMGGVDTIKALIKIDPQVRAIICSGYSDESALAAMESFGFKASLPKPFTSQRLVDVIDEVIRTNPVTL